MDGPLGDSACGQGKRSRGLRCIRLTDGRAVKETHCRGQPRPQTELETPCPTDCPLDCEVSAWTQWNESQCLCGRQERNMTRWRVVTTQASPSGRPCPAIMSQSKPCPSRPCYSWHVSTSACDLQGRDKYFPLSDSRCSNPLGTDGCVPLYVCRTL